MLRKQFNFGLLLCVVALTSCHSSANKGTGQSVQKKDPVKVVSQSAAPQKPTDTYVILDTVVKRDTIKVVLYNGTMIRCSVNQFSDTYNAASNNQQWDNLFEQYCHNNAPFIFIPNQKKPQKFILNDSLLIIPVPSSSPTGGMLLFLLNRTKNSLVFSKPDDDNPVIHAPYYIYVDIKNNTIIDHDRKEIYDEEEYSGDEQNGRFVVYRYKISNKHFIRSDVAASYLKQFNGADFIEDSTGSHERTFYNYVASHENWKRDKYDSSNYQEVTVIDTILGKDTIAISYDNKGNIMGGLNRKVKAIGWPNTWIGYEDWQGAYAQIISPGKKDAESFEINDSLVVFDLVDKYGSVSLIIAAIHKDSLCFYPSGLQYDGDYYFVDLKKNLILEYAPPGRYTKSKYYKIARVKIVNNDIVVTNDDTIYYDEFAHIKDINSFQTASIFYNAVLKHEKWGPNTNIQAKKKH
jgi:hypothetical protein